MGGGCKHDVSQLNALRRELNDCTHRLTGKPVEMTGGFGRGPLEGTGTDVDDTGLGAAEAEADSEGIARKDELRAAGSEREIADPKLETELATTGAEMGSTGRLPESAGCEGSTMAGTLETVSGAETNEGMESETAADFSGVPLIMRELGIALLGLEALLSAIVDTGSERRIN